jgi:hypothetical protein
MRRDKREGPSNDNMPTANDNRKRQEYMREYMARRRHGGKTMRDLLRDLLAVAEACAPGDDLEAQLSIAAARDRLQAPEHAREGTR